MQNENRSYTAVSNIMKTCSFLDNLAMGNIAALLTSRRNLADLAMAETLIEGSMAEQDDLSTPLRVLAARQAEAGDPMPFDLVILTWQERRRPAGVFECVHGDRILLDLPIGAALAHGMRLVFGDGRNVEIITAEEKLTEITAPDLDACLRRLRQLDIPTQREPSRLLIARDDAIESKLHALGATMRSVSEPFEPSP